MLPLSLNLQMITGLSFDVILFQPAGSKYVWPSKGWSLLQREDLRLNFQSGLYPEM